MIQIAILVAANSHLSVLGLRQALERRMSGEKFTIEHVESQLEPYPLQEGVQRAEAIMARFFEQEYVPFCIAVIAALWKPPEAKGSVRQEVYVAMEKGDLRPYRLLTPRCAQLIMTCEDWRKYPNQAHFSREGIETLVARILERQRILKLV